ncbi:LOW QUALITY PROTEIN: protein DMP7-like [Hibiscus syriacus]|uniref:LOW QUALITY PROTEIN: protein DMP7-like n=1 Tax=Hibiscus syriacus TaxID=106335 RepID=UPI001920D85C|nr:LOW QUALITY PROTEIN: protein DMP7-like [Hibiscus syriacus]
MDFKAVEHEQPLLKNMEPGAGETVREEPQAVLECSLLHPVLKRPKTKKQKIVRKTFKGTAILSRLLPTGSALTFQLLSPILTNNGQSRTEFSQNLVLSVVAFCAGVCFFFSFTDSYRDERGKVRYGVATFRGLWVMDGKVELSVQEAKKYKLKFIDFLHALVSVMIFMALVLFDQNVVNCFRPKTEEDINELWLMVLPASIGAIGPFFVAFPSKRHGIGCLSPKTSPQCFQGSC